MNDYIYRLADGRLWDVQSAKWLEPVASASVLSESVEPERLQDLVSAEGVSDEAYLAKTLEFYNYPLGELAWYSIPALKRELANLDAEYLTPRTLAGLSSGDETAKARCDEHEEKAAPIRQRIKELEETAHAVHGEN